MNYLKKLSLILYLTFIWSCIHNSDTEKYQNSRDNIIYVHEKVKEIKFNENDVLIGRFGQLSIVDNYLIIKDSRSLNKLIYLFDKNQFTYLASTGERGQGPNEITNLGFIGTNDINREFYVSDHGKQKIFAYGLDSVLVNPDYVPSVKMEMNKNLFPSRYQYINDTLAIGIVVTPIGNSDFDESVAKWNMNTGEIKPFPYRHPDIEKKYITFAVSTDDSIYVECYLRHDLMTICSIDGSLKYNIYGPKWNKGEKNIHYYDKVVFCKDKILAAYSGGDWMNGYEPTKFLVFDRAGNYIKTLETGYLITDYCYDKTNHRIIMHLDDVEIQFAYLDLNGLID